MSTTARLPGVKFGLTKGIKLTPKGDLSYSGFLKGRQMAPGVLIGSVVDSSTPDFIRAHKVAVIINCTRNIPFSFTTTQNVRLAVDDADDEIARLFGMWKRAVPFIDASVKAGKTVLVHCYAGQQRSAATVAAYLMYKRKLTPKQAIAYCKKRKDDCFWPTAHFRKSLHMWEEHLNHKNIALPAKKKLKSR